MALNKVKYLLFAAAICFGLPAKAAHIQSVGVSGTSSGTSVTFPAFTAIGSGNSIVALLTMHDNSGNVSSVTVGSTAATIIPSSVISYGAPYIAMVIYLFNITGGPTTVTVNFNVNPSGTDHYLALDEYSGQLALDGSAAVNGGGSSTSLAPNITTTVAGDTIWTVVIPSTTPTTPSGFTTRLVDNTNHQYTADEVQGAAGSVTATWNWTSVGALTYAAIVGMTSSCGPASIPLVGAC